MQAHIERYSFESNGRLGGREDGRAGGQAEYSKYDNTVLYSAFFTLNASWKQWPVVHLDWPHVFQWPCGFPLYGHTKMYRASTLLMDILGFSSLFHLN